MLNPDNCCTRFASFRTQAKEKTPSWRFCPFCGLDRRSRSDTQKSTAYQAFSWSSMLDEIARKEKIVKIRQEVEEEKNNLRLLIAFGDEDSLEDDDLRRAIELGIV